MKTAIVTSEYHLPMQTFINSHILHLFDGQVCVITRRFNGKNPYNQAVFVRTAPLCCSDSLIAPVALVANRIRFSTSRPPFGRRKAELRDWLLGHGVKIILAELATEVIALAPLAHEMGIPIFSYFRGSDITKHLRRPHVVNAFRKAIPMLTGVISESQFLLDILAQRGIQNSNAHVIHSGVDTSRFRPGKKKPKSCVAAGRMVEVKSPLTTIRAFAAVAKDHPEARLTMLGGGPLLENARALVAELRLQDCVNLTGEVDHETVRATLANGEIFLQHSVIASDGETEGLPVAIQEAMSSGCVVVSTRHAGIPEAVEEGVTGYLVDEHDSAGYAAALGAALSMKRPSKMGRMARDRAVAQFDNNRLLARLEDILRAGR